MPVLFSTVPTVNIVKDLVGKTIVSVEVFFSYLSRRTEFSDLFYNRGKQKQLMMIDVGIYLL